MQTVELIAIIDLTLTDFGLKNYELVYSIVFAYLEQAKKWLMEKDFFLFTEAKTMADISFDMYKVPD